MDNDTNKELIAEGWIYGYDLVVPKCPICENAHRHGNHGYKKGDITARMSHCKKDRGVIHINIQGELTEQEYDDIVKCCDRKKYNKKSPFKSEQDMINIMCENCEKIFSHDDVIVSGRLHKCPLCGKEGLYNPGVKTIVVHGTLEIKCK